MTISPSSLTPKDATITAAQIADLAGVSRAAVSNWRRRYRDDFPEPVSVAPGGGDLFRYGDIEDWLRKSDRLGGQREANEELWQVFDTSQNKLPMDRTVEVASCFLGLLAAEPSRAMWDRLLRAAMDEETPRIVADARTQLVRRRPELRSLFTPLEKLEPEAAPVLGAFVLLTDEASPADVFEELLRRRDKRRVYGAAESVSSRALTEMMARIAEPRGTIFDPACGEGGFLLAAFNQERASSSAGIRLVGQEINERTRRTAQLRFLVHGVPAEIHGGDSLVEDALPDLRADVVLCDPPFGGRWSQSPRAHDDRWFAGTPGESSQDMGWLQHVIHHLRPDGRGYVALPSGSLFRQGREGEIRRELVRRGCVEAIVSLPRGLLETTTAQAGLWVVERPDTGSAGRPVLLINDEAHWTTREPQADELSVGKVRSNLRRFRNSPLGFKQDTGFAFAVNRLELLAPGATLMPAHWVKDKLSFADAEKAIRDAEEMLALDAHVVSNVLPPPEVEIRPAAERRTVKVRDLSVEAIRGLPIKKFEAPEGLPVLLSPWTRRSDYNQFVNPKLLKNRKAVTQQGDVVVMTVSKEPRAFVDRVGGHVLPDYMQALRIKDQTVDPLVLAALISAPINARYITGSVIPRLNVMEIEIPVLLPNEMKRLATVLESWSQAEMGGALLSESAVKMRQTLMDGIVAGAVTVEGT